MTRRWLNVMFTMNDTPYFLNRIVLRIPARDLRKITLSGPTPQFCVLFVKYQYSIPHQHLFANE